MNVQQIYIIKKIINYRLTTQHSEMILKIVLKTLAYLLAYTYFSYKICAHDSLFSPLLDFIPAVSPCISNKKLLHTLLITSNLNTTAWRFHIISTFFFSRIVTYNVIEYNFRIILCISVLVKLSMKFCLLNFKLCIWRHFFAKEWLRFTIFHFNCSKYS